MVRQGYPLTIVRLAGDERTMGEQHGAITRALGDYEETLAFYPGLPERTLAGGHRGVGRGMLVTLLRPLVARGLHLLDRARPAALRERSRAFLRALGAPADHARHVMILDVLQNTIGVLARAGVAPDVRLLARDAARHFPGACSSFAAWGESSEDGRVIHGRNFDLPGIGVWERRPEVVFCTPTTGVRYGFVATRGAEVPGVTAFNEAGLVLSAHTRFHRTVRFDGRGVVDLGHLIVSRARTLADAIAIAAEQPVASSWGLFVSSARERSAIAIEVHGGRVAVVRPDGAWHACTNRMRTPVMQPGEYAPSPAWIRYSDGRLAVMERALGHGARIDVAAAKGLLARREAGDSPEWSRVTGDTLCQTISIQSVVVDPERQVVHVGCGDAPTSLGPWVAVPWRWDGPTVETLTPDPGHGDGWPGFERFMVASRLEGAKASIEAVDEALAAAVDAAPGDPSYHHLAGGSALRCGRALDALWHFEAALDAERSHFRRGELHLWALRAAAAAGREATGEAHRRALMATGEPHLAPARKAARRSIEKPRSIKAYRDVAVDFQLLTLGL